MKDTRFILVRHGNATSGPKGQPDQIRKLTENGMIQANLARIALQEVLGEDWKPGLVVASDRLRAQQTAMVVIGLQGINHNASVHMLPSLIDHPVPEKHEMLTEMFEDLGYAPLRAYHDKYDRDGRGGTLGDMAQINLTAIQEIVRIMQCLKQEEITEIAIFGHAVILPAIAYLITLDGNCLDINMGEADALICHNGEVQHLQCAVL